MDKDRDSLITDSQFTIILIGSMFGVGIFSLPNDVVKTAGQDGWISCILGAVYPLYMILIASYLCKKAPRQNIYKLSINCFGKIIGTILNIVFTMFFLLFGTQVASGMSNILRIFMTPFLSNNKLLIVFFLIPAFIAYKGIKTLGRMSEVVFYLTLILFFIPIGILKAGSILNIMPVFGSGLTKILKASKDTAFAYTGIECIFIIFPYLQNSRNVKKDGIKSIVFTMIIYTWFTFMTIYYIGIDIIPKFIWSVITVTEPVFAPVINSFKFIFMVMWTSIMFRTIGIYYYSFTYSLSELIKKIPRKNYVFIVYPFFFYLSTKYGNPTQRGDFLDKIVPIYVSFNLIYVSVIALILAIKKGDGYENKMESK